MYGPIARFVSTYPPFSLDTVVRTAPVAVCVALISTPGKTAPLWSFTVPVICAVEIACPHALEARTKINVTPKNPFQHFIFILLADTDGENRSDLLTRSKLLLLARDSFLV